MHFEVLVEDLSGKKALDILIPKIIGDQHTFRVIEYRGIGHIPKNLKSSTDASKRILLNQLIRLLRGHGKTFASYPANYSAAVIVVCDLDDKCLKVFRQELFRVLNACNSRPETRFCIAIEEGEAWLLGDIPALKPGNDRLRCLHALGKLRLRELGTNSGLNQHTGQVELQAEFFISSQVLRVVTPFLV